MRIDLSADWAISNALGVELINLINHKLNKERILNKVEIKDQQKNYLIVFLKGLKTQRVV